MLGDETLNILLCHVHQLCLLVGEVMSNTDSIWHLKVNGKLEPKITFSAHIFQSLLES